MKLAYTELYHNRAKFYKRKETSHIGQSPFFLLLDQLDRGLYFDWSKNDKGLVILYLIKTSLIPNKIL